MIRNCMTLEELQDYLIQIALSIGTLTVHDKIKSSMVGYREIQVNGVELSWKGDDEMALYLRGEATDQTVLHLWITICVKGGATNMKGKSKGGASGASKRGGSARPKVYPGGPQFVSVGGRGQHQSFGLEVTTGELRCTKTTSCFTILTLYLFYFLLY
jgi:hypothetical protein